MTLIAITCQGDSAQVLTDTAAYTPNKRHLFRTTKIAYLPHLDAMVLAAGIPAFGAWARFALEGDQRIMFGDFDTALEVLPELLQNVWGAYTAENPSDDKNPGVILAVGWSDTEERFVAAEFGSDDLFEPAWIEGTYLHPTPWRLRPSGREYRLLLQAYEELGAHPDVVSSIRDGWMTQPPAPADITPTELVELAKETREDRSMGGGIPIHGELVATTLRRGRMVTKTVHTFPTSGPEFERFIEGSDHPVAQAAACFCGSGLNVLACCRADDLAGPCRCGSGATFADCCMVPVPTTEGAMK